MVLGVSGAGGAAGAGGRNKRTREDGRSGQLYGDGSGGGLKGALRKAFGDDLLRHDQLLGDGVGGGCTHRNGSLGDEHRLRRLACYRAAVGGLGIPHDPDNTEQGHDQPGPDGYGTKDPGFIPLGVAADAPPPLATSSAVRRQVTGVAIAPALSRA